MLRIVHTKVLRFTHGAEHYAAVAYSTCEFFELHRLMIMVTGGLIIFGVGSIVYEIKKVEN